MNRAFGVSEYEQHAEAGGKRGRGRTRRSRKHSKRRVALKWTIATFAFSLALALGLTSPFSASASHTTDPTPGTPWTVSDVENVSNCAGAAGTSIPVGTFGGATTPPDLKNGNTSNQHTGSAADKGALAIWANADNDPVEKTLDISGSHQIIDGLAVSRSHLLVGGSWNQFRHGTEYGQRSVSDKVAFDLAGSDNCFTPMAEQVYRNAPPAAPAGFPLSNQFDPDGDGMILEHFAPGTDFANAAGADYYRCTSASSPWGAANTIPSPLTCSSGNLSGGVQGTQMLPGLYFVSGTVSISPSNLTANVTIVSGGLLDVSGSTQSNFAPFHMNLLFASEHIASPSSANTTLGEPSLKTGGSVSRFEGITVSTNGRNELSGSNNSWTCPVMGDRVRLNGSLLYLSGEDCAAPSVTTEIHAQTPGDSHVNLGDGASSVEVGTTIHDKVVVASASDSDLTGTITLEQFDNGTCAGSAAATATWTSNGGPPGATGGTYAPDTSITIDPALPFTPAVGMYSYRATYGGDDDNPGPVVGACEGPVRVVDARISIAGTETNAVGDQHTFTVTVGVNDGTGWVNAPDGTTPTVTVDPAPGGTVTDNCADPGTTDGQCTVVINSDTPGVFTANASVTITVGGISLTRDTSPATGGVPCGGGQASCGPAVKTYVDARISLDPLTATNPLGTSHTVTVLVEVNPGTGWIPATVGDVSWILSDAGSNAVFDAGLSTCDDGDPDNLNDDGECTIVFSSATPGTTTVNATATVTVGGLGITRTTGTPANTAAGGTGDATKDWVGQGATLLIIDEDSIDNGIHVNKEGGFITPSGPQFFGDKEVNDHIAKYGQRTPLQYFANPANFGKTITVKTGQTGDEGWFAPTCIPQKWVGGTSNTCLGDDDPARQTGIDNFFGANNVSTLTQSKLDKIPAVMPLRALGLKSLESKDVCAVVYDSDISINYDKTTFPFTSGNLQGATLGIVAFTVETVHTLRNFSSSTLPQVKITINDPSTCNPTELFNAPVPRSSSVPNDINGESPINHTGSNGYRQLKTFPLKDLFF